MLRKRIFYGILFGIIGASGIAASVATFVVLKNKKGKTENNSIKNKNDVPNLENESKSDQLSNNESNKKQLKEIPWKNIFPDIKSSNYYNMLNFRNGQAWIDEEMIVNIIKDIINRATILDGEIKYAYKIIDDQTVLISFIWKNSIEKTAITYKISTNKL
ncbi:hypothetical protein JPM7_3390 [Metamycoplasma equirhinis]|uniref:MHO_1590 family protein n=1 Tax=Metamycoplasma equirhinis TaxID=92402 RepID=UPI0025745E30|nr:hypothetical protein [Metamycoplasma equirhinis]BDX52732.1 hypothetical protein JPM7_3390 [Metamycoplasma equirhinis]